MFLTGFDAKTVNTLYVDKSLRWHGLIQAFSRTKRIISSRKSHGNVVCFRDLKERTDEAVALFANKDALATVITPSYDALLERLREEEEELRTVVSNPDAVDALPDEKAKEAFVKAFREVIRARSALETHSQFRPEDLSMAPQEFEDFKSKYLDIEAGARGGGDGGDGDGSALLSEIDFELELIRRDEINVAYILALLTAMTADVRAKGAGSGKAKRLRKRIIDLLRSEVGLRGKAPLIRKFMDEILPGLAEGTDLKDAFVAFWDAERNAALSDLVSREGLDEGRLRDLMRRMAFSGKASLSEEVSATIAVPTGIIARRQAAKRILEGIARIVEVFDEGIGDLSA